MKYKVGDLVRVRSDLVVDGRYGSCRFAHEMAKFKGKVVTIASVLEKLNNYRIEEGGFYWTDEMLEPIEEFNVGDVVYTQEGEKMIIKEILYRNADFECYTAKELSKTKPLKEITEKELAEMGFVIKK